jgi:hypothetical protein
MYNANSIYFYSGNFTSIETLLYLKDFAYFYYCSNINSYLFNSRNTESFFYITKQLYNTDYFDSFILYNINCKLESAILCLKLRKLLINALYEEIPKFFYIGTSIDNSFLDQVHLGLDMNILVDIVYGRHFICIKISKSFKCHFITKTEPATNVYTTHYLIKMLTRFVSDSIFYNSNSLFVGEIAASANNIVSDTYAHLYDISHKKAKFLYLLGSDDLSYKALHNLNAFIVYQGHHADYGAGIASLIFPTVTHFECISSHIDISGKRRFINPVMRSYLLTQNLTALTDVIILKSLHYFMYCYNKFCNYDYEKYLKTIIELYYFNSFCALQTLLICTKLSADTSCIIQFLLKIDMMFSYKKRFSIEDCFFINSIRSYYSMEVFSRASKNISMYLTYV